MANSENEITFGQLLSIFKKSLKKAVVYMLITVVAVTSVLIFIKGVTDKKVYRTTISFTEVTEQTLDSLNYNKSNAVGKALAETRKSLDNSTELVKNLSIAASTKKKNVTETEAYLPTTFELSLRTSNKLNFTSNEYKELLDSISRQYVKIFSIAEMSTYAQSYDASSDFGNIEYFQIADKLSSLTRSLNVVLSDYLVDFNYSDDFRSSVTNKTFSDIIISLELLEDDLESIKHYIVYNKAELSKTGIKDYLSVADGLLDSKIANYQAQLTNAKYLLDSYTADSSYDKDGNLIVSSKDSEIVLKIITDVNTYSAALARHQEEKSNIGFYSSLYDSTTITTTGAAKDFAEKKLKEYSQNLTSIVEEYKEMAKEYNHSSYLSSTVVITSSAVAKTDAVFSDGLVIVIVILAAILAYCVAFFKTLNQVKKETELEAQTEAKA